jgi:hypothetical protein
MTSSNFYHKMGEIKVARLPYLATVTSPNGFCQDKHAFFCSQNIIQTKNEAERVILVLQFSNHNTQIKPSCYNIRNQF